MENDQEIELRSEEVQEILTRPPSWMIRWGSVIVLLMVALILLFSFYVKYPDLISTQITITTEIPPERLLAKTNGRIEKIFVENMQEVEKEMPLAIIENTASYQDVFQLKKCIEKISLDDFTFPYESFGMMQLGPIQEAYTSFEQEYIAFSLNRELNPYAVERTAHGKEGVQLKERYKILSDQFELEKKANGIKKESLDRDEILFEEGAIPLIEWERKKLEHIQASKNVKNLLTQLSQVRSAINELYKSSATSRLNQTMDEVNQQRGVYRSLAQLKKAIQDWELAYVISSSVKGKVSFMQVWVENQTIESGQQVFTVVPSDGLDYIGKIKAPATNTGKIKEGQKVNIRLMNYPAREFGILSGEVKSISLTPDHEGNLLIDVAFPNGIETSYNKKIVFQQEMSGSADIVTEDLRLIERFFYQFKDMFNR
ncbi:MAG: HlyD family secretion protein [Crocinitomicaceae bacterium]